jgi:O-methyltransferase domain/Dimerisation domain
MVKRIDSLDVDPYPIFDILLMPYAFTSLVVAVIELELFTKLSNKSLTIPEVSQLTGTKERPIRILMRSFVALGLLDKNGDKYSLTNMSETFLVKDKPFYLGDVIAAQISNPVTYEKFKLSMETGAPSIYDEKDIFERHKQDRLKAELFTKAMHVRSIINGSSLVRKIDFSRFHQTVDIGGGSGGISIMVAMNNAHIHSSIFDLPAVCDISDRIINGFGLSDRVKTIPGDMFKDDLKGKIPNNTDVVIFSRILHDWPIEKCEYLLRKAFDLLPSGGLVVIIEGLIDEESPDRVAPFWENLGMLLWTEGEQFSKEEIWNLLDRIGFGDIKISSLFSSYSVISAFKYI